MGPKPVRNLTRFWNKNRVAKHYRIPANYATMVRFQEASGASK